MKELTIRDRELGSVGLDPALGPAIDAMREDLSDTRADVAQMQERLDFTERLLAAREPAREIEEVDSGP
jgi:hypothetical protein